MDHAEFRVKGKEMIDFIADYLENVTTRRVYPDVQPGFLHRILPKEAPKDSEEWDKIFEDVNKHIMTGIVHWQSPHMHAYFPALNSYPSIMGDLLCSGLNTICFTWASSPAGTELETIAMNWLGKAIGLPDCFLSEKDHSLGGGVIQTTASEATLVSLLAARTKALVELAKHNEDLQTSELLGHLIAYCSDQAHSSVEKAGLIGLVRMRFIESDENQSMRGDKLEEAILADKAKGMVPFWVCATLGTTGTTAFDHLREVGEVCDKHSAWLHVDAAYAGTAFICPEFRHWFDGIELADSFAFNPSKWMMVNFDCTAMWVKDSTALHKTFNVNPIYLRHENSGKAIDYMIGSQKSNTMRRLRTKDGFIDEIKPKPRIKINGDFSNLKKNGKEVNENDKIKEIDTEIEKITGSEDLYGDEKETIELDNKVPYINDKDSFTDEKSEGGSSDDLYGTDSTDDGIYSDYDKPQRLEGEIQLEDPNKKEFLHWQIPLSRRFRALKLWFVLRNYGITRLQNHVRQSVHFGEKFEKLVEADARFEIPQARTLGMVVFRLKGENVLTEKLLKRVNARGFCHCVPAQFKNIYVIRYVVTSPRTTMETINEDWHEIKLVASELLTELFGNEHGNITVPVHKRPKVSLKELQKLNATFGTSLLLANSPMSPKIVNGTHVAICDYEQVLNACARKFEELKLLPKDSPEMRRRIRGMNMSGKKFSLDSAMDLVHALVVEKSLPKCEEEREEGSNGSSPGDKSSVSSSPVTSIVVNKQDNYSELNQLEVPPTPSRQHRSKSVDHALSSLKLEDADIIIDLKTKEITITPTASENIEDSINKISLPELREIEEEINIGDSISQAFENFQDGLQGSNDPSQNKENVVNETESDAKITIKGPGSYIKKLIQQFSEGPFDNENPQQESDRAVVTQTIKDRADAICKKCLHYKGRITK